MYTHSTDTQHGAHTERHTHLKECAGGRVEGEGGEATPVFDLVALVHGVDEMLRGGEVGRRREGRWGSGWRVCGFGRVFVCERETKQKSGRDPVRVRMCVPLPS